ncbi:MULTISPECIES: hypothetical protein [Capnocytophaga]|uniref:DUF4386 domain-containing protein n=4 Tax=Capnocytophaga cynodegmi TaxID=28189 RepID=A0A0B7HNM3_9FLAO|nr:MULTISPECIES: hypothetical protein [Capnocytophaga]CEN33652.1 membrane hypothetical protein [Capnocytophaga cynodegmi]CEN40189.1 membrane hypothetical protein [Capnocytophaga cynodegmi]
MVLNTLKSNRIFIISGWLLIVGFCLLAVSLLIVALTLPMPSADAVGVKNWVTQNLLWLQVADELLAFATPVILTATLLLYGRIKKQQPINSSLAMMITITLTIGTTTGVVLPLGRLVYPVNGLPTVTGEMAVMTASQVFAGIHWLMLILALFILIFSRIISSSLVTALAIAAVPLQIVGTYYASEIFIPLALVAIISLLLWGIASGIYLIKKK